MCLCAGWTVCDSSPRSPAGGPGQAQSSRSGPTACVYGRKQKIHFCFADLGGGALLARPHSRLLKSFLSFIINAFLNHSPGRYILPLKSSVGFRIVVPLQTSVLLHSDRSEQNGRAFSGRFEERWARLHQHLPLSSIDPFLLIHIIDTLSPPPSPPHLPPATLTPPPLTSNTNRGNGGIN